MKKEIIRREALKRLNLGKTYKEVKEFLEEEYDYLCSVSTLKDWKRRLYRENEWNLRDKSRAPIRRNYKFSNADKEEVVKSRRQEPWSPETLKYNLARKGIYMSASTVRRIIKKSNLSSGSVMEGKQLKWIRWQRKHPNSLWQIDGAQSQLYPGKWMIVIEDDYSRYCLGIYVVNSFSTDVVRHILTELIRIHGKPREILADNGSPFKNRFDRWCKRQEIKRIHTKIGRPQTTGKVERLIGTIKKERNRRVDLEQTRYIYNTHRPHQSRDGLYPCELYFGIRTVPIIL